MEALFQYIWKHRMLGTALSLQSGEAVEILSPGVLNNDAGPDFSNARIRIGSQLWCGNVEIHVKASDWYAHRHDSDPAYDNVILHVVALDDRRVTRQDGTPIPQLKINYPESFYYLYELLSRNINSLKCADLIPTLSPLVITDWVESLAVSRLQSKSQRVLDILTNNRGDWQQCCFVILARALGFGLNADPFEHLANTVPLKYIRRHSDNLFQIEAILFGQAGMLDPSQFPYDPYYQQLCREYQFLSLKYGLQPMRASEWKYARTRPSNFPHRRIAFLARAIASGESLLSPLLNAGNDLESVRNVFKWKLDDYWTTHSAFNIETPHQPLTLSKTSIDLLVINFAIPILYAHAAARGNYEGAEKILEMLRALPAENNSIIRNFNSALKCDSALSSQALLHLNREYCNRNRCLECRFGHSLLRKAAAK